MAKQHIVLGLITPEQKLKSVSITFVIIFHFLFQFVTSVDCEFPGDKLANILFIIKGLKLYQSIHTVFFPLTITMYAVLEKFMQTREARYQTTNLKATRS